MHSPASAGLACTQWGRPYPQLMSTTEPPAGDNSEQPEPRYLSKWVREETFWKDVTTRTLAGLIVVFVAWGVGIAAGVFTSEGALEGFMRVAELCAIGFGAAVVVAQFRAARRKESIFALGKPSSRSRRALYTDAVMFAILPTIVAVDFVSRSFFGRPIL